MSRKGTIKDPKLKYNFMQILKESRQLVDDLNDQTEFQVDKVLEEDKQSEEKAEDPNKLANIASKTTSIIQSEYLRPDK